MNISVTDVNEAPAASGEAAVDYAENGTDPVGTYSADDPDDGDSVTWSLSGADADSFTISEDGILSFAAAPASKRKPATPTVMTPTVMTLTVTTPTVTTLTAKTPMVTTLTAMTPTATTPMCDEANGEAA